MRPEPADPNAVAIARSARLPSAEPSTSDAAKRSPAGPGPLPLQARRRPDPRLVVARTDESPAAAAFRILRYKLQYQGNPRIVLVTSARPDEGKTTCAVNLALAIAEHGDHVLLVEACQRTPQLAHLFGFVEPPPRVTDLPDFPRASGVRWWLVELAALGLHVASMSGGPAPRTEIDGACFAAMMRSLRSSGFDYIVIDAPPVLGGVTVNFLQEGADRTVLVTRARRSRGRDLRAAIAQLAPESVIGIAHLEPW